MAQISTRQLAQMCHRFGTSLDAGVDVMQVLQREASHGTAAYQQNLSDVSRRVGQGMTLAEGLRECQGYFPSLACELINVGEQTGRLEWVLLRLAEHYDHLLKLRRTFLLGVFWPLMQLIMAVIVVGLLILLFGVLNTNSSLFGLSGTSGLMTYAMVVLTIAVVLGLGARGLMRGWFGPVPGQLMMRTPVIGKALQAMALARFSWTLSLALNAGMDAARAMRMALFSTQNAYYTQHADAVEAVIMRGGQFYEALRTTGAFSDEFLVSLENAEVTGTESESLTRLSEEYRRQAEAATTALALAASWAIWCAVAILLVFMIFHLFMNLYMKPINEALEMMQ